MNISLQPELTDPLVSLHNENSSISAEEILSQLNRSKVLELSPIIATISCLMVFGLAGNGSVLLFFRRKAKKDTPSFFIMTLAVVDWIVCLGICLTIAELTTIYSFTNDLACKLYVITKMFASLFSAFILLTIAGYRYRKICCPFKRQLTLRGAKIAVGCDLLLAIALSVPQIFLFGSVSSELPNEYNVTVTGYDCGMRVFDDNLVVFNSFMSYTYAIVFAVAFISLIIVYSLQGKAIAKFKRDHRTLKNDGRERTLSRGPSHESQLNSGVKFSSIRMDKVKIANSVETLPLTKNANDDKEHTDSDEVVRRNKSVRTGPDISARTSVIISQAKITVMFLIITICFMFSFLPYLSYSLWRSFNIQGTDAFTRDTVMVQLCLNSYLINSITNPLVYGWFHIEFRHFIKRTICKLCFRRTVEIQQRS